MLPSARCPRAPPCWLRSFCRARAAPRRRRETGTPSVRLDVRAAAACTSRADSGGAHRRSLVPHPCRRRRAPARRRSWLPHRAPRTSWRIRARDCRRRAAASPGRGALLCGGGRRRRAHHRRDARSEPEVEGPHGPGARPSPPRRSTPATGRGPPLGHRGRATASTSSSESPRRGRCRVGGPGHLRPRSGRHAGGHFLRHGRAEPARPLGACHLRRRDARLALNLAEPGGTAAFALDAASLDACPLRLRWSGLTARPCATALVGRLSSSGSDTPQQASATRPFAAAGAAVTASVGSSFELSGRLGIGLTVVRDRTSSGRPCSTRAAW